MMCNVYLGVDIWFCLGWVGVLYLGSCCPLWILPKCGSGDFPGREWLWVPNKCGR